MKLAPLTRHTRLFARRTVNLGSGVRLLPGQELNTRHLALPWRRITQMYEQRRLVSERDPYFEEIMRDSGTPEPEVVESELEQPPKVVHKGGGWYDVLKGGEALNEKPLRKDEAQAQAIAAENDLLS